MDQLMGIIESHGAQAAFPTSTIHMPEGVSVQPTGQAENAEEIPPKQAVKGLQGFAR